MKETANLPINQTFSILTHLEEPDVYTRGEFNL